MFNFSKVSVYVDENYVLSRVSESTIFSNYFGKFELGKIYSSPFRKDRNPSTGFYISRSGNLIFNDIKTGEKLNCFRFVGKLYGLSYNQAITKVAEDFGLIKGFMPRFDASRTFNIDEDVKKETLIQFHPGKWSRMYLDYWKQGDIEEEDLPKDELFPVSQLFLNKREIATNEIRFAQVVKHEGKDYTKIYSPYSKTMKWLSNIPLSVPFGMNSLLGLSDTVFIAKSFKDMLVLKKIFTDVIATQNESEAALTTAIQEELKSYKNKIIVWDNDETGVENCKKFNDKGFGYFNIPRDYYLNFGIKDPFDFVSYYGLRELKKLFIEKGLL